MYRNILLTIMLISISSSVLAKCKTSDIKGTWRSYGGSSNVGAIGECLYHFNATGVINNSSSCSNYTASADFPPVNIIGRAFTIDSSCNISGTIETSNGLISWFKGQMNRNKNTFAGISRNNTGTLVLHNFIKQ